MYSWIWRIRNVYTGQLLTSEFDLSETTLVQNIAFTKDEKPKQIFREMKKISKGTEPRRTDLMIFSNEVTSMKWPHHFCINHNQNLWPWLLWNGNDSFWPWPYYVFLSPGIAQNLIQINDRCKPSTCPWIVHCRQTRQKPQQLDWDCISIAGHCVARAQPNLYLSLKSYRMKHCNGFSINWS